MKSKLFTYIVGAAALILASWAAIFSVTGLSMLYSGSLLSVSIAMGGLEFSKLVVASYLYRYWRLTGKALRLYLSTALLILMFITSGGIYGYLINAYQGATIGLEKLGSKSKTFDIQNKNLTEKRNRLVDNLLQLRAERKSIINNRTVEIAALNKATDSLSVKYRYWRTTKIRDSYKNELNNVENSISKYMVELDSTNNKLSRVENSIASAKTSIIETGAEIGTLVYMSRLFNTTMDNIVRWFTLVIVLVFDPLAISLVIGYNRIITHQNKDSNMYTKKQLKEKNRKDLVSIAKELGVSGIGKNEALMQRIIDKEQETFKEHFNKAPITKDADITIDIEDVTVDEEEPLKSSDSPVDEEETEDKESSVLPPSSEIEHMVSESTAFDILNGWNGEIRAFFSKNVSRIAPKHPTKTEDIAAQIGVKAAIPILNNWKNSIINQLRPSAGIAPATPLNPRQVINKIKNELSPK